MNPAVANVLQKAIGDAGLIVDADMAALKDQISGLARNFVDPNDVLTGRVAPTVFPALQKHVRSPQVPGTKVGQDQELLGCWGDAGGVLGDSNPGTTVKPHGQAIWRPQGFDGAPARLTWNPAAAYDNLYFWMPLPTPAVPPKRFFSGRAYQFPGVADQRASQAVESDSQIVWSGWKYNFGVQQDFATKTWRVFNPVVGDWEPVAGMALVDLTAQPVIFTSESVIDTNAHTITRVALTVNGRRWVINKVIPARQVNERNKYSAAVQLDALGMAKPPAYSLNVLDFEERYLVV